MFILSLFM
jgi:hypothetical protein